MVARLLMRCLAVLLVLCHSSADIISVPDLHGDYERTVQILQAAQLIDANTGAWIGGNATLVQTGDIVDRGTESLQIYRLFARLADEAPKQGGQVINLLGNHELMSIQGDFRYVHHDEMRAAGGRQQWQALWQADGEIGRQVRKFKAAAKVGPVLFVHAGLDPLFLKNGKTLQDLNDDMSTALSENGNPQDNDLQSLVEGDGPLWTRFFTYDAPEVCEAVAKVLKQVGAVRMVVGHTIQDEGVNSLCGGSLILADTGISGAYGGEMSFIRHSDEGDAVAHYPRLGIQQTMTTSPISEDLAEEVEDWADFVGQDGEDVKRKIETQGKDSGIALVQLIPQGSMVTMDMREDRVRIFVDEAGKVAQAPRIG